MSPLPVLALALALSPVAQDPSDANPPPFLVSHQDADGRWDADGFAKHDPEGEECGGAGRAEYDVSVTALAILAMVGDGNTLRDGPYKRSLTLGVEWLTGLQDAQTGLLATSRHANALEHHAMATLAMCELSRLSKSNRLEPACQLAVDALHAARRPGDGWSANGARAAEGSTLATGWSILALVSARAAGLDVDDAALEGGVACLARATDCETGRVASGWTLGGAELVVAEDLSPTAMAVLCRVVVEPERAPEVELGARLVAGSAPQKGQPLDALRLFLATQATYQFGGDPWKTWNKGLKYAVSLDHMHRGVCHGSWDPAGTTVPGGRVAATALMALTLEAYFRYASFLRGL